MLGYPELYKANRTFEWSRFNQWQLLGGFQEQSTSGFVTSTLEVRVSRSFYQLISVDFPLKITMHVTQIGRTSFRCIQYLRAVDPSNEGVEGEVLMARDVLHVNVDFSGIVKKSLQIEDDIRQRCQLMLKSSEVPSLYEFRDMVPLRRVVHSMKNSKSNATIESVNNSLSVLNKSVAIEIAKNNFESRHGLNFPVNLNLISEPPPHAFRCTIIPRTEDCDLYKHVTQSFYLCYIREAEAQEFVARYSNSSAPISWKGIPADPAERLVSRVVIQHKRELKMYQPMEVVVWYDEVFSGVMHFIIKNNYDDIACLAFLEFHSDLDSNMFSKL